MANENTIILNIPTRYWEDPFALAITWAWMFEVDQFNRWTQFEYDNELRDALNGEYLYEHEGILAQWMVRLCNGQYIGWWEQELGIPTDLTLSDQDRRNNILSRLKQRGQAPTPQFINGIVEQYVQESVVIVDIPHYMFNVQIIQPRANIADNIKANIVSAVEAAKPAHMAWQILYTETDWTSLANRDWATIQNTDWANLRY